MKSGSALDKLKAAAASAAAEADSNVQNVPTAEKKKKVTKKASVFVSPRGAPPKDTAKEEKDRLRMMLPAPTVSIHQVLNDLTPLSVGQRTAIMNHLSSILSQDHLFSKAESEFYGGMYLPPTYIFYSPRFDSYLFSP